MPLTRSLPLLAAVLLLLPATAQAARLEAGKSCFENKSKAHILGSGFAPESPIDFTVNGKHLTANVTSDEAGDVSVTYAPPHTDTEKRLDIRATDSEGTTARTTIYVTQRLLVRARPAQTDDVSSWRAVFSLYGFGRGRAYIHYLNPNGKPKKTVRLGRLRGPCGRLKTSKRRVLPFDKPQYGRWKLQFDTRRRFSRGTLNKRLVPVDVYRG